MGLLYLGFLLVSLACVVSVDLRFRLFLGRAWRPATAVLAVGTAFFLLWDLAGIGLGIFLRGNSPAMTGILLAPELPLEEPVFLLFLCEVTMVLVLGTQRVFHALARSRRAPAAQGDGPS